MKLKTLTTALMALAIGANFAVAEKKEEDTPLSKEMSTMNKSLRTLKRQAADASKKAENLELVAKIKTQVAASLKYEPAKTKDQPAADKPAYLDKFKKEMGDLDKAVDDLKAAIEKGDAEATTKVFEKLADIKEKGHKDFAPDE
jgi:soluble cytochrome b562